MQQRWPVFAIVLGMAALFWAVLVWPRSEPEPLAAAGAPAPSPLGSPPSAAPPAAAAAPVTPSQEPEAEREPSPEPENAAPPSAAPAAESPPLFEHDMGPVAERKQRFAIEPRDSAASDAEAAIRDAFKPTDTRDPLLRSVLCRAHVCKLELQLTGDQLGAYVAAMTRITQRFDKDLAVTRTAQAKDAVSVEVYLERLPEAP